MSQTISLKGYERTLADASRRLQRAWMVYGACLLVIAGGVALLAHNPGAGVAAGIVAGLLTICVPPLRNRIRPLSAVGQAMQTFAAQNEMRYVASAKPNYDRHFQPAVAKLGLFERKEQIVVGTYDGLPFETYVQTYRHPLAYRWSRMAIRVYRLRLPAELPHIFISNRQSGSAHFSSLMRHFDDNQRVRLEGNFEDQFTTYTHRRTMTETLSLLAPNVMATLLDSNQKFDVEIVGNYLCLYTTDYYTTAPELQEAFTTINHLMKHINHRLKSWKFTLPNNRHYPYLVSRPGFGTLTLGHTYYNQSWLFIAAYTAYSLLRIKLGPDYWQAKVAVVVASDIVMIGALLVFRRRYQLERRNVGR